MGNHLGIYVKEKLRDLGKKQTELAEFCGVSDNAVAKWIRTGQITIDNAVMVADFLNCSLDDLVGRRRESDVYIQQLLHFFKGMTLEHKDDLLYQAQRWYSKDNPNDKRANPYEQKPKPAAEGVEQ
jgi:transcriptional regulator with XRE-family HTH domain